VQQQKQTEKSRQTEDEKIKKSPNEFILTTTN
jgi:hypothetical protein